MSRRAPLLALMLALCAAPALSAETPQPVAGDPRVRAIAYASDQVVALQGHYGYQIMVEFGADERIENVAIGDSLAWQVTPNRRADTLFLKPIERDASTNLVVVTTKRRYAFVLTAAEAYGPNDPDLVFRVRFSYPDAPSGTIQPVAPEEDAIEARNAAYSVSGSTRTMPVRIFDDGLRTYMRWPPDAATPAVFALAADGSESVVNFSMRGSLMVVQAVAPAFVLRNGAEQTLVFNDGWREPAPGADAPRVRSESSARSFLRNLARSSQKRTSP
jgi:type IV secretion system protein VirB9